jgi:hypothetical protein
MFCIGVECISGVLVVQVVVSCTHGSLPVICPLLCLTVVKFRHTQQKY